MSRVVTAPMVVAVARAFICLTAFRMASSAPVMASMATSGESNIMDTVYDGSCIRRRLRSGAKSRQAMNPSSAVSTLQLRTTRTCSLRRVSSPAS